MSTSNGKPRNTTVWDLFRGVTGSQQGTLQDGPRKDLDEHLTNLGSNRPFPVMLQHINRGLGLHTDVPLETDKSQMYKTDSTDVETKRITSFRAFVNSSIDWHKRGDRVGTVVNIGGSIISAMYEGMEEDRKRKTGRID